MTDPAAEFPSVDGRRARRDRNRETVVDALLELYREGEMAPSVARVAERSGVSHRSVFRYFEDLDELLAVAIERQAEAIAHLVTIDGLGEGSLCDRIERLVEHRLALYEEAAPVARVARMRAPLLPLVADDLRRNRELLRRQIRAQFRPELDALDEPGPVYSAAAVLCSLESIELLRYDRELSPADAGAALRAGLSALFPTDHSTA
jgi:AcrR family transcriptional regulator